MLTAAGALVLVIVIAHSVLGEILLLRHLPRLANVPELAPGLGDALTRRTIRLTWHVPSLLGVAMAAILLSLGARASLAASDRFVVSAIAGSMLACGALALVVTRGRHPAWVAFLLVAALAFLA